MILAPESAESAVASKDSNTCLAPVLSAALFPDILLSPVCRSERPPVSVFMLSPIFSAPSSSVFTPEMISSTISGSLSASFCILSYSSDVPFTSANAPESSSESLSLSESALSSFETSKPFQSSFVTSVRVAGSSNPVVSADISI
ncbi:hypothetical protein SDC9_204817 [bioreactor metagenome]|uniref:Uncharacterized protein n=1 Tax=bioreactor metagenome TaxID=1076179 RepID=A0A645JC54_9ZZZZ